MADPAPEQKADPAVPFVVSLTPEQYDARLRQVASTPKDAPPPSQMEMGGSGTAKASFKDAAGGDVAITSVEWSATGPITVTADEADPTSAKIVPTGLGSATVTATNGLAQAHAQLMVIEKVGAPVSGTIEITVAPPAPPEPPVEPPPAA
jgi:hypothetical protein